ncbi:MAG: DUF1553 domain-containing protein, partial [Planctomycetaceae bacterium]|nr:DUF1553 domain-containing protein [Planctomycetaceae bacterium]
PPSPPNPAEVAAAQGKLADAATNVRQAELQLGLAEANLLAIDARLAADRARFASPTDPHAEALALAASRAQRQAAVWNVEKDLASAELDLAAAQKAGVPDDPATGSLLQAKIDALRKAKPAAEALAQAATEAAVKVETIRQQLATAQQTAKASSTDYAPLDTIYPMQSTGRRLALARWIASPANPLTPRVAINHIWMRHFGEPLVGTVFDFGLRGQRPTHPEMLDWLAAEFVERGWSMKTVHRLLVTSQAYRRASTPHHTGEIDQARVNQQLDPDNRHLWRMNPRRMEAETVRDSVLAVAGELDFTSGGPDLDHEQGFTSRRRSVYFRHASEKQMLFLKLFDTASVNECYRRSESIVPQQGLALANSPLAIERARHTAARLAEAHGAGADLEFVVGAFEHILSRRPTEAEQSECLAFLAAQHTALAANSAAPSTDSPSTAATPDAVGGGAPSADPRQRARESLILVLLNHHDFVTIR